jgi:RimJ/RimL family protein N-acetyltransferase
MAADHRKDSSIEEEGGVRSLGTELTDGLVRLREIQPTDAELLYSLRMNPQSREMFRNTGVIPFETHAAMVERYLSGSSPGYWFVIEVARGPVGTISLYDFDDGRRGCEFGRFAISPDARNSGYGRRALRLVMKFAGSIGVRRLYCEVLSTNSAALNLYRDLGFVEMSTEDVAGRTFVKMVAELGA